LFKEHFNAAKLFNYNVKNKLELTFAPVIDEKKEKETEKEEETK